jgi:deoxyribonuclease-1-like protein
VRRTTSYASIAALLGGVYMMYGAQITELLGQFGIELPAGFGAAVQNAPWAGAQYPAPTTNTGYGAQPYSSPPLADNRPPALGTPAAAQPPIPIAGRPSLKIGSYNIQVFGESKGAKPQVMQALAHLVRMFDVIAIQEIRTQNDYFIDNFLRTYVNQPGLPPYDRRVGRRLGRTNSTEQYAFLYNTATVEVNPQVVFTMEDPNDLLHREPMVAMFRAKQAPPEQAFTFILMNVHTDPDEAKQELDALAQAYTAVQRMPIGGSTEDDIILLGDLNTNVPAKPSYMIGASGRPLQPRDFGLLGELPGIYPLIQTEPTNTAQSKIHDNIVINRYATSEFTGQAGVVDLVRQFNTTIEFAGELSDHLPVWGEFSLYESAAPGRIAVTPASSSR